VRAMLKEGGAEPGEALEFVEADCCGRRLARGRGRLSLCAARRFAVPVEPATQSIRADRAGAPGRPARAAGGARRRRRARRADSSFAAIGYGHKPTERPFTEEDWTELDDSASPYVKSKTLAERAAWDFVAREGGELELAWSTPSAWSARARTRPVELDSARQRGARRLDARRAAPLLQRRRRARRGRSAPARHDRPRRHGRAVPGRAGGPVWIKDVCDLLRAHLGVAAARVPTRRCRTLRCGRWPWSTPRRGTSCPTWARCAGQQREGPAGARWEPGRTRRDPATRRVCAAGVCPEGRRPA